VHQQLNTILDDEATSKMPHLLCIIGIGFISFSFWKLAFGTNDYTHRVTDFHDLIGMAMEFALNRLLTADDSYQKIFLFWSHQHAIFD
jgi:uncharacterized membrane protein YjjP (DUF1212 family)